MEELHKQLLIGNYEKVCPICNYECRSKNGLGQHLSKSHSDIMKHIKEYREIIKKISLNEFIECPICGDNLKELSRHLKKKHNLTVIEFKNEYPLIPLKAISALQKKGTFKCEVCGKIFKTKSGLGIHYKTFHNEYFEKNKKTFDYNFECPLCKRKTNNIKQHIVDGHNMKWEYFCENYNWDVTNSKYISDTYRNRLSKNKKQFYSSEKGIKLRKQQSENMKGDKNLARDPKIRSKISKSAIKRMNENPFFNKSYGVKFKFEENGEMFFCRSFEELKTMYHLIKNKIPFKYEKTRIRYKDGKINRNYILDFEILDKFYEVKFSLKLSNTTKKKMELVEKTLSSVGKTIKIVTLKELSKDLDFEINIDEVYEFCRQKIENDTMYISCYSYNKNSRILNKININYKNHKNIKFTNLKEIK